MKIALKNWLSMACALVALVTTTASHAEKFYYVHNDHLGTPQVITDENKNVVWEVDRDPWGNITNVIVDNLPNNVSLPGQYDDVETGYSDNGWRPYDKKTGQYIQSDPIGQAGGLNTYLYANANPVMGVDPLGLETTMVCRPVDHWFANLIGGATHCAVVVWHWEEGNGVSCTSDGGRVKVIDKQYSLAANQTPYPQGTNTKTYNDDTKAFKNPSGDNTHYPISPPVPYSQQGFDNKVINSGDNYSQAPYSNKTGPNSNTAADNIIEGAGGVAPDVPGAYHQNHGE